ncbi:hypothetical protein I7I48_08437 [Histoplasma ohiense]|nr:hypothetical protein I7I48_08437 [Histoplasma ohiense (nom. inval.)]
MEGRQALTVGWKRHHNERGSGKECLPREGKHCRHRSCSANSSPDGMSVYTTSLPARLLSPHFLDSAAIFLFIYAEYLLLSVTRLMFKLFFLDCGI